MGASARDKRDRAVGLGWAALALAGVVGLHHVGLRYEGFPIPYGFGIQEVPAPELVFYLYLLGLAGPATWALAESLRRGPLPARCLAYGRRAARSRLLPLAIAGVAGATALLVRELVLLGSPVADDEATYRFIAQTLLEGRVANPSPGDDGFFGNQFIILDGASWYGKYPLGHPAALALGEALGLRGVVVPLVTALSAALTFAVGRRILPAPQAALGALLLLVSPQFLFTGATQLSQPTSGLCMLVALLALLAHEDTGRLRFAVASGFAFGAGILVRPLPGVLFLGAAGIWLLVQHRRESLRPLLRRVLCGALPAAACLALLAWVQWIQTGNPAESGYHTLHGPVRAGFHLDLVAPSVAGAFVRQNFWLFGWASSFVFLPFAARGPRTGLLWALVGAEYLYRILVPKTVVAATGPIYVAEVVPLLALLTASGLAELAERAAHFGVARARERVAALAIAAVVIAAVTFVPVHVRSLHASASRWQAAHRMLDELGADPALVFADWMVDPEGGASWAYHPPNPTPRLAEPRIFVRIPKGPEGREAALDFWQRRFPERSAWVFQPDPRGGVLQPLAPSAPRPEALASGR